MYQEDKEKSDTWQFEHGQNGFKQHVGCVMHESVMKRYISGRDLNHLQQISEVRMVDGVDEVKAGGYFHFRFSGENIASLHGQL